MHSRGFVHPPWNRKNMSQRSATVQAFHTVRAVRCGRGFDRSMGQAVGGALSPPHGSGLKGPRCGGRHAESVRRLPPLGSQGHRQRRCEAVALGVSAGRGALVTGAPYSATTEVVRTFNTAGPVRADRHFQIAPLSRIDLDEVLGLIRDEKYFVLHAPRQTGKTSALAGAARPAERRAGGRLPLPVRQCRKRSGDARERGRRHAHRACRAGVPGERDAGRRAPGRVVARASGTGRAGSGAAPGAGALVHGGSAPAWCC